MAGLMDILLGLVKFLCGGGSATEEQPTSEYQRPQAERPPRHTTRPTEYQRPAQQEPKPRPRPQAEYLPHRPHQDQNQVNQHDGHYTALRAKANVEGDLMAQCFQRSHEAYARGNGALAKQLSEEGKRHERTMESLNGQASAWIFRENNTDSKPGEIDLHGLYVKEAVSYAEKCIREAKRRGDAEMRLIVGKGLHSDGHVPKIKPAIEDLMNKYKIPTEVDPRNGGVLIARLS